MLNASRLTLARRRRGWTKARLAREVGVSSRSVTAYESGEQQPTEPTLDAIATALAFPLSFFSQPDVEYLDTEAASFRSLASMTASQRDQALGAGTLALLIDDWIEKRFERPAPDVPEVETSDPEAAAEQVRAAWALGERPITNVVHLLERHGIRVFSLAEESRNVDAFSFWRCGRPYVLLNTMKTAEHSRMDGAHELGHLVLHRDGERGREAEHAANKFGSAFLMPRASMLASNLRMPTLKTLIARKAEWKVSVAALVYRLHSVGMISEWHYRSLFIDISKLGYRKSEPLTIQRETSQVLMKVLDQLRSEGITRKQVAEEIGINVDDFDRLVFGLVPLGLDGGGTASAVRKAPAARGHLHLVNRGGAVHGS